MSRASFDDIEDATKQLKFAKGEFKKGNTREVLFRLEGALVYLNESIRRAQYEDQCRKELEKAGLVVRY